MDHKYTYNPYAWKPWGREHLTQIWSIPGQFLGNPHERSEKFIENQLGPVPSSVIGTEGGLIKPWTGEALPLVHDSKGAEEAHCERAKLGCVDENLDPPQRVALWIENSEPKAIFATRNGLVGSYNYVKEKVEWIRTDLEGDKDGRWPRVRGVTLDDANRAVRVTGRDYWITELDGREKGRTMSGRRSAMAVLSTAERGLDDYRHGTAICGEIDSFHGSWVGGSDGSIALYDRRNYARQVQINIPRIKEARGIMNISQSKQGDVMASTAAGKLYWCGRGAVFYKAARNFTEHPTIDSRCFIGTICRDGGSHLSLDAEMTALRLNYRRKNGNISGQAAHQPSAEYLLSGSADVLQGRPPSERPLQPSYMQRGMNVRRGLLQSSKSGSENPVRTNMLEFALRDGVWPQRLPQVNDGVVVPKICPLNEIPRDGRGHKDAPWKDPTTYPWLPDNAVAGIVSLRFGFMRAICRIPCKHTVARCCDVASEDDGRRIWTLVGAQANSFKNVSGLYLFRMDRRNEFDELPPAEPAARRVRVATPQP